MIYLLVLIVCCLVCGGIGGYVAAQKGRSELEGFLFGFLLGPIGILIAALLPTVHVSSSKRSRGRDRIAWMPDYRDDWDEPKVVSSDGIDEQVLNFLNDPRPDESAGKIDIDAIRRADHRPRES